jgi:hypothetical protein
MSSRYGKEPLEFAFGRQTYRLPPVDFNLELAFQAAHEAWARRRLAVHRREVGEEEYAAHLEGWRRDVGCGVYAFGGPLSRIFLYSDPGLKEYAYLLMRAGERLGGAAPSREALDALCEDNPEQWDELRRLLLGRDFPLLVGATPPPSTDAPSPSSVASPGAGTGISASAAPGGGSST